MENLLLKIINKSGVTLSDINQLKALMLADEQRANALNINSENITQRFIVQSFLLPKVYPKIVAYLEHTKSGQNPLTMLWNIWLPLALKLAEKHTQLNRTLIQGILGVQGTGKTTLAAILKLILEEMGYQVLSFSLDDLYKTYQEREELKRQDPRLIWRGPPGTHDVELGIAILNKLKAGTQEPVMIPRFDKSAFGGAGDRTKSEVVNNINIVLFEGWFVGVKPVNSEVFKTPPHPIITEADWQFAADMNDKLKAYLPLWELLDQLLILYPLDYRFSLSWRKQAEQQMKAQGKPGMSDSEIEEFVNYFWQALHPNLFIKPLVENVAPKNLVITINAFHNIETFITPTNNL